MMFQKKKCQVSPAQKCQKMTKKNEFSLRKCTFLVHHRYPYKVSEKIRPIPAVSPLQHFTGKKKNINSAGTTTGLQKKFQIFFSPQVDADFFSKSRKNVKKKLFFFQILHFCCFQRQKTRFLQKRILIKIFFIKKKKKNVFFFIKFLRGKNDLFDTFVKKVSFLAVRLGRKRQKKKKTQNTLSGVLRLFSGCLSLQLFFAIKSLFSLFALF